MRGTNMAARNNKNICQKREFIALELTKIKEMYIFRQGVFR